MMCHFCGSKMVSTRSYRVLRCENNAINGVKCGLTIDRDINAAMNMGLLGLYILLHGDSDRPPHLRTKKQIKAALERAQADEDMLALMEMEEETDEMEIQNYGSLVPYTTTNKISYRAG